MDNALREQIKNLMVENLMLQVTAAEIGDDQPLFGPGSLGLDSVDALQLVVALDKNFGLKVPDPAAAKQILQSVNTIAAAVEKHRVGYCFFFSASLSSDFLSSLSGFLSFFSGVLTSTAALPRRISRE